MPLAAALAAGGMRPASFLPTIKCSSCGDEIEISAMGEHICSKAPPSPKSQPASLSNPFTLRQINASRPAQPSPLQFDNSPPPAQTRQRAPTVGSGGGRSGSRGPRAPAIPMINPDAANKPFLAPYARPGSPLSPAGSSRSGSRPPAPMRSMTSPMPRLWDPRPPSPELSANLDCAFPPFPFGEAAGSRPGSSNGRRTPSERGSSRAGSRSRQGGKLPGVHSPEPQSPPGTVNDGMMGRMNIMNGGPYGPGQSRPTRGEQTEPSARPVDRRRPSMTGNRPVFEAPPPIPPAPPVTNQPPPAELPERGRDKRPKPLDLHGNGGPPQRPARPTESLSPTFLNTVSSQPAAGLATADFPLPPKSPLRVERSLDAPFGQSPPKNDGPPAELHKMPSEPALRGQNARPPPPAQSRTEPYHHFPKRSTSRGDISRFDFRLDNAPPVPKPVQQLNRSNSRHRPSGSDSSTTSSHHSGESSNHSDSPATSAASSVDALSPLSQTAREDGDDSGMRVAGLRVRNQDNPGMRAEQPRPKKSPPRNFARPAPPPSIPPAEQPMESPVIGTNSNWPLESPMDPGLRNGVITPEEPSLPKFDLPEETGRPKTGFGLSPADISLDEFDPYKPMSPMFPPPQQQEESSTHSRARSPTNEPPPPSLAIGPPSRSQSPIPPRSRSPNFPFPPPPSQLPAGPPPPQVPSAPPIPQDRARRPSLGRRPTMSKPICRGCSQPIEGKSVKAADGRLTGRWHKACFVCKTCSEAFTSADFYVHANNPYCEQHYHEKNGSLCAGCRRGIEGQYLETLSTAEGGRGMVERKFHPRCFTCASCRSVLAEDYFEIGGRVFCERHALAAMRATPRVGGVVVAQGGMAGPGGGRMMPNGPSGLRGLKAERRTTRLMMM